MPTRFNATKTLVSTLAMTLTLSMSTTAFAQDQSGEGGIVDQIVNNLLSSTTIAGLLLTTTVGAPITTTSNVYNRTRDVITPPKKKAQMDPERERRRRQLRAQQIELYVRGDGHAIQQAIAAGGGDVTGDLATLFGVPQNQHARFVDLLRENRQELLPLLDGDSITAERTRELMMTVERAMANDKELALYLHELMIWEVDEKRG
jgi:hypothetical protein